MSSPFTPFVNHRQWYIFYDSYSMNQLSLLNRWTRYLPVQRNITTDRLDRCAVFLESFSKNTFSLSVGRLLNEWPWADEVQNNAENWALFLKILNSTFSIEVMIIRKSYLFKKKRISNKKVRMRIKWGRNPLWPVWCVQMRLKMCVYINPLIIH